MDKWYFVENDYDGKLFCVDSEGKVTCSCWHNPDKTYSSELTESEVLKKFNKAGYLVTELGSLENVDMSDLVQLCQDETCDCHKPDSDQIPISHEEIKNICLLDSTPIIVASFILIAIIIYLTITNFLI